MDQKQVVVVGGQHSQPDYTIPRAKIPAVMMLVIGSINGILFLVLGAMTNFGGAIELLISFLLYFTAGLLGTLASFKQQRTKGMVVGMIVACSFTLILTFAQVIWRGLQVTLGGALLASPEAESRPQVKLVGSILLGISATALLFAILVFILAIVLIVFGSKVVCACCGAPNQSAGVVYQAPPGQMQA